MLGKTIPAPSLEAEMLPEASGESGGAVSGVGGDTAGSWHGGITWHTGSLAKGVPWETAA